MMVTHGPSGVPCKYQLGRTDSLRGQGEGSRRGPSRFCASLSATTWYYSAFFLTFLLFVKLERKRNGGDPVDVAR